MFQFVFQLSAFATLGMVGSFQISGPTTSSRHVQDINFGLRETVLQLSLQLLGRAYNSSGIADGVNVGFQGLGTMSFLRSVQPRPDWKRRRGALF